MTGPLVRLHNAQGADEANLGGERYPRHCDGCFYVPEVVAEQLCGDGRSGFVRAQSGQFEPAPGTVSPAEIIAMIDGLAPGDLRTRLRAAIIGSQLKDTTSGA